jgi:hypothetical protein
MPRVTYRAIPKVVDEIGDRGTTSAVERHDLRKVRVGEPEAALLAGLEREEHRAIRHSSHLVETAAPIRPVVQREERQGCVKRTISEGQRLGRRLGCGGCASRPLPDHV